MQKRQQAKGNTIITQIMQNNLSSNSNGPLPSEVGLRTYQERQSCPTKENLRLNNLESQWYCINWKNLSKGVVYLKGDNHSKILKIQQFILLCPCFGKDVAIPYQDIYGLQLRQEQSLCCSCLSWGLFLAYRKGKKNCSYDLLQQTGPLFAITDRVREIMHFFAKCGIRTQKRPPRANKNRIWINEIFEQELSEFNSCCF